MDEDTLKLIRNINERTIRMEERGKANGDKLDNLTEWTITHEAKDVAVAKELSERVTGLNLRIVYIAGIGAGLLTAFELWKHFHK